MEMTIRQFLMLCDTSRDGYRWNKLKIYDEFSMKSKEYWWHHDQAVREFGSYPVKKFYHEYNDADTLVIVTRTQF